MRHSRDLALTGNELDELFKACFTPREKVVICCLASLGMRVSEVAHLEKTWVDFQRRAVRIPASEVCGCGECKRKRWPGVWRPKSNASVRTIVYKDFPVCGGVVGHFFAIFEDVGITRQGINKLVSRVAGRTAITTRVTPHGLRATAASNYANAGLSAQGLREVMGWEELGTAQAYIKRSGRTAAQEIEANKDKFTL